MSAAADWRATRPLGRAVLLTGLLAIGAVVLGRVELVLLAAPFALGTAWSLRRRPRLAPALDVAATGADGAAATVEGGTVTGTISAANPAQVGLDAVVLRVAVPRWVDLAPAPRQPDEASAAGSGPAAAATTADGPGSAAFDRPYVVTVPPGQAADLELVGTALRWGRHRVGPAGATAFACDGLLFTQVPISDSATVKVYPATDPFDASEAMPRAAGLVGSHRSRRPGEGGELAGVRRYAPGDRLRRVDWRVSLRTRQLHVASTLSDRDAEVVLLLDLLAEAGRSQGIGGGASVLDTTVRAAAAIAEHYLQRGDRVSLVEYGPRARRLRPASGRRQYLTVLEWLLDVRAWTPGDEPYEQVLGPHGLSANVLVVVLTPLVDERSAPMLARLARGGRFVVAVDTLPSDLRLPPMPQDGDAAFRLWRLARSNTIGALREHGVPVVRWAGAGSLDQVLRDISRSAAVPRSGWGASGAALR